MLCSVYGIIVSVDQILELGGIRISESSLRAICQSYGVKELMVFGSAARGELRPDSDIDILVEFTPQARIGIVKFGALIEDLEALFHRPVDLVNKNGLKPWIRPQVLKDAQLLYAA